MYQTKIQELLDCQRQLQIKQKQLIKDFLNQHGYIYERDIAKGRFTIIVCAQSLKNNNSKVAIKIWINDQNSKIDVDKLNKQIDFQDSLNEEKYILQFIEKIQDLKYGIIAIVTEYCESTLAQILELNKFTSKQVEALTYQLLKGLFLCEEKEKLLRYIKPEKIFYSLSKNQFLLTKISFSKIIEQQNYDQKLGNLNYQSPEVIDKQKPYTITADVFSIGVIVLEALLQRRLQGMEYLKLKSQSLKCVFPFLSNEQNHEFVNKILSKMVEPKISQRSQPLNLLQHLNEFLVDENQLKLIKIEQNMEIEPIEHYNFNNNNEEEEENMFKNIKQNKQGLDTSQISDNNQGVEQTQIQLDIKQKQQLKQGQAVELSKIKEQKNDFEEEIELEKPKNNSGNKKKKNKKDSKKYIEQDIDYESQNFMIQADIKQLFLNLILNWQLTQNNIQNEKYKEILAKNEQIRTDLNLIIEQLKQKKQDISKMQLENFNIEDYQPFYENYDDDYWKEIKIVNYGDIPKEGNYGVVEIELRSVFGNEEQILGLGEFLKKCQKMRFLTFVVNLFEQKHDLVAQQLDQCINLVSLNLDIEVHKEGEKSIGYFIGQCKNLSFLNLKLDIRNNFGDFCFDVDQKAPSISKGLSQCQNLVSINLCLRQITKQDVLDIGESITKIKNLNFLNFDLCNIQMNLSCLKFSNFLTQWSNIITLELNFYQTNINYQDLQNILQSLQSLEHMKFLKLQLQQNGNYSMDMDEDILENIKYKSLTDLNLKLCSYCEQRQINQILRSFKSSENLNSLNLNLSGNNFKRGEQAEDIRFEQLKSLTHLTLFSSKTFYNFLGDNDNIDMSFHRCKKLISLNLKLYFQTISNEDLDYIGQNLSKCQNLKHLKFHLTKCQLEKASLDNFGTSLSQCVKLQSLNINFKGNKIVQTHAQAIGKMIANLQDLTNLKLNLSDSQIRQKGTNFISQGLESCKHLCSLSLKLSNSMISVNALNQLAKSLKQNKKIISFSLEIDRNKLLGEAVSSITTIINDHLGIKNLSLSLSQNNFDRMSFNSILSHLQKCYNLLSLKIACKENLISHADKEIFQQEVKQNCLSLKRFQFII